MSAVENTPMEPRIAAQLNALNRRFYEDFADSFATSRGHTEPGLERVLADVQPGQRLLDLGCGPGRIAALLPPGGSYVGLDYAAEMLALAAQAGEAPHPVNALEATHFIEADLLEDGWVAQAAAHGPYDWIVARAVLHHVPGYAHRLAIVEQAASLLAPAGRLVVANWQFLELPRLRRRLLPWERIGLEEQDVEAGDYLLDWQRDGYALRYVHLVDEAETQRLAMDAGLEITEMFRADGHNNNLTLYAVMHW